MQLCLLAQLFHFKLGYLPVASQYNNTYCHTILIHPLQLVVTIQTLLLSQFGRDVCHYCAVGEIEERRHYLCPSDLCVQAQASSACVAGDWTFTLSSLTVFETKGVYQPQGHIYICALQSRVLVVLAHQERTNESVLLVVNY